MSRAARLLVLSRALAKKGQEKTGSIKLTWAKRLCREALVDERVFREQGLSKAATSRKAPDKRSVGLKIYLIEASDGAVIGTVTLRLDQYPSPALIVDEKRKR